jgi:hypothetical protein
MRKKTVRTHQHPLDWLLAQEQWGTPPVLEALARDYSAEPFRADAFRNELTQKLNRLHYPQPQHAHIGERRTFAQVLERTGVLSALLSEDTLRELWKSLLLKKVFERNRELQNKRQSVRGVSLKEHWRRVRDFRKDLETLKKIAEKYDLAHMPPQYEKIDRRIFDELVPILLFRRANRTKQAMPFFLPPVPRWKMKLQRRGRRRLPKVSAHQPAPTTRIEDKHIQALIYQTLEQRLQTSMTYGNGIDDIFLCQLAELVWAPADVQGLSDGESLRRDINRRRS